MRWNFRTLILFLTVVLSLQPGLSNDCVSFFLGLEKISVESGTIITRVSAPGRKSFRKPLGEKIVLPPISVIPKELNEYDIIAEEKAFFPYLLTAQNKIAFYNLLFRFSSFKGMQYFSKREKKIATYIIDCNTIVSMNDYTAIPDREYSSIVPKRQGFFKILDNRFGEIIFQSEIIAEQNVFVIKNVNINPLQKFGHVLVPKGGLVNLAVYSYCSAKKGFYYYSVHAIKLGENSIITALLDPESVANRIRAETVHRASMLGLDLRSQLRP
ncbi:MAG: hypothetical protein N2316_09620 [Spirochaetes bacterium]|nr:hypothetical protein [Spirochaetota bacterium]